MRAYGGVIKELIFKVRLILYPIKLTVRSRKTLKGNIISISKESSNSLYNENKVSFEEEGGFSNEDMQSHIRKNILDYDI